MMLDVVRRVGSRLLWAVSTLFCWASVGLRGVAVVIDYLRLVLFDYRSRPDDLFIVTYPRSGTTWMQMILYQLTTDGDMAIGHIAEVCPWFERAAINRRDFQRLPSPRVFKSHLPYWFMPKGRGKYLYVARNGKDVAVSFYHFYKSHFRYRHGFERFFRDFMRGWVVYGSWFQHVRGWWKHRDRPNVLFLRYEDLAADLEGTIRRIAAFCGLEIPPDAMPRILQRCSFDFMKQHELLFDHASEVMWERGFTMNRFLRQGHVGDWPAYFTPEQEAQFDRAFQQRLGGLGLSWEGRPGAVSPPRSREGVVQPPPAPS